MMCVCVCVCVCVLVAQSCPLFNLNFMDKGMGIQRDELLRHSNTASKWASQNSNTGNLSPVLELIISSNVDFLISVWLQDCSNVWEGLCNVYTFFPFLLIYLFIYLYIYSRERNGNHSSILAWRMPWTEEPGGLKSMGSQRVRHDWATYTMHLFVCASS